jgi:hypothetical protein
LHLDALSLLVRSTWTGPLDSVPCRLGQLLGTCMRCVQCSVQMHASLVTFARLSLFKVPGTSAGYPRFLKRCPPLPKRSPPNSVQDPSAVHVAYRAASVASHHMLRSPSPFAHSLLTLEKISQQVLVSFHLDSRKRATSDSISGLSLPVGSSPTQSVAHGGGTNTHFAGRGRGCLHWSSHPPSVGECLPRARFAADRLAQLSEICQVKLVDDC